jgi:hypothetical protein
MEHIFFEGISLERQGDRKKKCLVFVEVNDMLDTSEQIDFLEIICHKYAINTLNTLNTMSEYT